MRLMTSICPVCGTSGQRFPLRFARKRQAKMSCRGCRVELRSDPRLGTYSLYLLYTQVIILVSALPLIGASVAGEWARLGMICVVVLVLVLCWLPGAIRHARSQIVRATLDPNRSYARRPGVSSKNVAAAPAQGSDTPSASP
ncbi:hypothetical protein I5W21_04125 [Stenotrophomonas maltophilia]|uniref:hypothetical protein n=1 Tax=Stenotrophomonas sp. NY11291 TaxID=2939415 RepID=UPI0018D4AA5A|nr:MULTISPECIES: hypothetical protein [Stenotrophomonas]MBH1838835.1 hypothetical protein [Stenotrophomonas maltophilia]UQA22371.1 hypothetical protein M1L61_21815 [Stenotrophomonas sp. NY11291]